MSKRSRPLAIVGVAVALIAGAAAGYFGRSLWDKPGDSTSAGAPRDPGRAQGRRGGTRVARVVTADVTIQTIGDRVAAVGTGRALRSLTISSEVAGVVAEIKFAPGDVVKEGQPLVQLKSEAEQIAVKLAQVKVDDAAANLKRYETLSTQNAVASVQVAQARTALALAQADLEAKQYELKRRTIAAPFAGVMGLTALTKGDYLQQGAAIATIDDRSQLLVAYVVSERVAGYLKIGDTVRATTPAIPGLAFIGKLTALDTRVDAASRTLRAEATIPNSRGRLLSGMTFSVSMQVAGQNLPTVPGLAIQWDRGGAYVWRLTEDGKVARVGVVIRRRENNMVSIEATLKAGDKVVVEGLQGLREGMSVTLAQN